MKAMLQRLTWLGKGLVLCAVMTAAGIYVSHAQKAANPVESGYEIDLSQAPELSEFEGFINYGSPIDTGTVDANGKPVTIVLGSKSIPHPVFSTRKANSPADLTLNLPKPEKPVILSGSKSFSGSIIGPQAVLEELNKLQGTLIFDPTNRQQQGKTLDEVIFKKTEKQVPVPILQPVTPMIPMIFSGSKVSSGPLFKVNLPLHLPVPPEGSILKSAPGMLTLPPQPK